MKYETPELTALTSAISAIQGVRSSKDDNTLEDGGDFSHITSYSDWE